MRELDATRLIAAFARRKRWEARTLAMEIWNVLGEAMSEGKGRSGKSGGRSGRQRVSASEFMKETGAKWA
jgi:hypothetical protein